uniref:FGGY family carbohydrate kinase n=1 Tax=Klebsiella pneumoniae TaxID=573 RepID=UPI0013301BBD|nr:FGGY family carbohydrate kinase [Klebsiella pneumoniae]
MKDKILTIDVGTGSTRAAIVRIDGAMIGFAQREYEQTTPRAGWSEQAPSLWWQAACDCIREVLYRYPETAAQIAVIGACGQMHGTVLLDDRGELVEDRALLWNDKRSQPQVDAFNAREGWEKWLAHLNNPPAAAWPAFKLAWWRENHPDRWSQLAKVLMPKDYINFMLTGAMATDFRDRQNVTVVTNDYQIARELEASPSIQTILLGGIVKKGYHCVVAINGRSILDTLNVDKAFMGTNSLSLKHGACVADIMLAETKRGMVEHASQVIIVCDYSKLNNTSLAQFTAADRIDTVVVDRLPDDVQAYRNAGIQVISLDEENLL